MSTTNPALTLTLTFNPNFAHFCTTKTASEYSSKVKYTSICIAHFTQSASNALRHGSHSFTCKLPAKPALLIARLKNRFSFLLREF